jgi:stage V sporulation protein S
LKCLSPFLHTHSYLSDDHVDLTVKPSFRTAARNSLVLSLTAIAAEPHAAAPPANEVTLTVASASSPAAVAGAIAAKVREELPVCLKCVGALAVANALYAIATARIYLQADGIDVCALPEFAEEALGGDGDDVSLKTVLKLTIAITPREEEGEEEELEAEAEGVTRVVAPLRGGGGRAQQQPAGAGGAGGPVRRGGRPPRSGDGGGEQQRGGERSRGGGGGERGGGRTVVARGTGSRREELLRVSVK